MVRQPEARPGFTLTEVLMALFVMAIGMISLLALFPVGFINARWALDNEQVSRGAANAQAMTETPQVAVVYNGPMPLVKGSSTSVRNDDAYRPEPGNGNLAWQICADYVTPATISARIGQDTFLKLPSTLGGTWTFSPNPRPIISISNPTGPAPIQSAHVKLPPVFVDPFVADRFIDNGIAPYPLPGTNLPLHVGANNANRVPFRFAAAEVAGGTALRPNWSLGIPRFSLSQYWRDSFGANPDFVPSVLLRKKLENSMGDEVDFASNGVPNTQNNPSLPGQFASQRRFTWAYMCQWPSYATPEICDVSAVVFNSRPDNGGMLSTLPPGESTFGGNVAMDTFGRTFVKGLTQAAFVLPTAQTSPVKVGDWVLDSTFILPEFNPAFPQETAPFLDEYSSDATCVVSASPVRTLRPGVVGGQFYKVLDVSAVRTNGAIFFQTITLDRPAKSDGFTLTHLAGVADVITKGVGRMPQR